MSTRPLYVAVLAATAFVLAIAAGNSAQAQTPWTDYTGAVHSGIAILPDPVKTPGEIASTDEAEVCGRVNGLTYEKRTRGPLTQSVKASITRSYGMIPGQDGDHELDHRVPAALGGKSSALNVWWQPGRGHGTVWDFHVKDRMDTWAWRQVCVLKKVPLAEAQAWFMEPDWTKPYCRLIGGEPCPAK